MIEGLFGVAVAAFIGYLAGRQNARAQVFRQLQEMTFLSFELRSQVQNFLIHRSGK